MLRVSKQTVALALAFVVPGCSQEPVRDLVDVEGKPVQEAIARFGTPSSDGVVTVRHGEQLYEFQNGLYPTAIDTLAAGASADVRQVMWDGRPERAVWAVERDGIWVVVDAMEWDADVEF